MNTCSIRALLVLAITSITACDSGEKGEPGETGPAGPAGDPGAAGAPAITRITHKLVTSIPYIVNSPNNTNWLKLTEDVGTFTVMRDGAPVMVEFTGHAYTENGAATLALRVDDTDSVGNTGSGVYSGGTPLPEMAVFTSGADGLYLPIHLRTMFSSLAAGEHTVTAWVWTEAPGTEVDLNAGGFRNSMTVTEYAAGTMVTQ